MDMPSDTSDRTTKNPKAIRQKLWDSLEPSKGLRVDDDDEFLPRSSLRDILTERNIHFLLQQIPETQSVTLDDITGTTKRIQIFAILILIDKINHISHIIQQNISDVDLPLTRDKFKGCPTSDRSLFQTHQSLLSAPSWNFSDYREIQEDIFGSHQRLPFLSKSEISNGGQGKVWKVEIHPDHYATRSKSNCWACLHQGPHFAVKEFRKETDFRDELKALNHFSKPEFKHERLIKALAAYSQFGKHYLILPLAEGNLEKLWRDAPQSSWDPLWLVDQCHGLMDALLKIHEYDRLELCGHSSHRTKLLGRHGDIKPQNILWFRDPSTGDERLVLSDFTLMRFHIEGSDKETSMGRIGGTRTYCAPEVDANSRKRVTQKYDVWSLGCVFLEFVSCYLVGYEATYGHTTDGKGPRSFRTERVLEESTGEQGDMEDKYFLYHAGQWEAKVKESVKWWFSHLHGQKHCSDALHDFLGLVQHHMFEPDPATRWSVGQIATSLAQIRDRSREDGQVTEYCLAGRPWKNDSPSSTADTVVHQGFYINPRIIVTPSMVSKETPGTHSQSSTPVGVDVLPRISDGSLRPSFDSQHDLSLAEKDAAKNVGTAGRSPGGDRSMDSTGWVVVHRRRGDQDSLSVRNEDHFFGRAFRKLRKRYNAILRIMGS